MNSEFITELQERLAQAVAMAKKENKKSVFCLASTKNKTTKNYYFTSLRISHEAVCLCLMIRDLQSLDVIVNAVDGQVDYLLYDAEVKFEELKELSEGIEKTVHKSKVLSFLGNKMSSSAAISSLQAKLRIQGIELKGKRVLLFGAGHLGAKIAQDLMEFGCKILLIRRDKKASLSQASALNALKPNHGSGEVHTLEREELPIHSFDVLIGCASETSVLGLDIVEKAPDHCFFMDVGLGNFSEEALAYLFSKGRLVHVANILNAFSATLDHLIRDERALSTPDFAHIEGIKVFKSGIIAPRGSIIVDDVLRPHTVYGVSAGNGLLLRGTEEEACQEEVKRIRAKITEKK